MNFFVYLMVCRIILKDFAVRVKKYHAFLVHKLKKFGKHWSSDMLPLFTKMFDSGQAWFSWFLWIYFQFYFSVFMFVTLFLKRFLLWGRDSRRIDWCLFLGLFLDNVERNFQAQKKFPFSISFLRVNFDSVAMTNR